MWWMAGALAGSVYVNDVLVDPADLAGVELKGATVTADADGNLFVKAPGYTIKPVDPTASLIRATPAPAPAATPAPGVVPSAPVGDVPSGAWWLYAEDQGSSGHSIDVVVNGVVATTVRSGQGAPVILDLQKWLRRGTNDVECVATSRAATGGTLYVYLGRGEDRSGTVNMGTPDIQFGVGSSREGTTRRAYTLEVP